MGRYRGGGRDTTDQYNNISIKRFKERWYLKEWFSNSWTIEWSRNGEVQSSMSVWSYTDNTALWFSFSWIDRETQERKSYHHAIWLTKTPCNYWWYRYWLVCPRCWKKHGKLYVAGNGFYCRKCLNLCYSEQNEGRYYRYMNKVYPKYYLAEKLRETIKYPTRNGKYTRKYKTYLKLMRSDVSIEDAELLLYYSNKQLQSIMKKTP